MAATRTFAGKKGYWLLDNAADNHVCNQKHLFATYYDDPTQITGATGTSTTSPGKGTIRLNLALENELPGSNLTLTNVWFIPLCPANLVSQARLNDSNVFYNNEDWTLYLAGNTKHQANSRLRAPCQQQFHLQNTPKSRRGYTSNPCHKWRRSSLPMARTRCL